jgi:hypothetical protein
MIYDFNFIKKSNSCISSRFDRFNIFFPLWLKNAINYNIDVIILIDKFDKNLNLISYIDEFKLNYPESNINVVDVSNYGNINEINNVMFFSDIFRKFYNLGYKNIIYTDPDELLLCDNLDWFLDKKEDYCFSQGFEIVQNLEIPESEFTNNKLFLEQRNFGVWCDIVQTKETSWYCKLTIYKNNYLPRTIGRHAKEYTEYTEGLKDKNYPFELYTVHLREMDITTMLENYKKTIELYSYCKEYLILEDEISVKNRLYEWFMPNLIEIPEDIKKIIIKHNL